MKERRSSLDDINYRFRTVLNKLGIPDDKQGKMQNLALDLKMDVINSLDKECIKENNIRIFLDLLKHRNSLLNILSLKSIMLEGKNVYFEIFMKSNGIRILEDLTYKILFENERYNTPNKALYEKNHHENIKEIGPKWSDRNFNVEYDFQMYYAIGKHKNISDKDMSENSREYMLNEVLGCILTITQKYRCFEFDIAMIVRNSYLFVYTRNFYELIDFFAEHQIEKLDFLFKSDKIHLCYVNTYFYDIYKENSKFKAVNKFLLHARYRNIAQFILNEIRNENKKRPFNIRPGLSEKTFNNVSEYNNSSVKQDQKRTEIMGERIENTTTCTSSQLLDVRKSGNMLDDLRAETLTKLGAILKDLENEMLINLIPCYLQAFIADPETFKTKNNTAELTKEIERLKIDNERLRLAVVNMENKHSPIPVAKKVEEKRFDAEQKTIEVAVEEKLNNMTIKPKKMPFKRKTAAKTTNVYMTPYSKKTYYPLRWSKCTKSGNIWEDVNNAMKYENLTQIFTPDDLFCYEKKLAAVNKQGKTVSKVRTIFSSKKGQAISIALGRVKMTDQEIKVFIFQLNESKLGENMIRQLLKNYPKKDEFELLRALKMEIDLKHEIVGRAEQFYFEFIFCQQELYTYLAAIYFKLTYPSNAETIREMINKLTRIYTRALESKAIKEFCQYALFLGNVFNNNTFSGNAEGFNFESITAIIDYKGNNKEKLLDDITNKMQYDIIADLKLLTAENIKYDGLCIQFSDVVADYDMIVQTEEIKKYLMPLIKDFEELKNTYKELNTLYAKFNKYYNGENVFESFTILLNELQKKK